MEYPLEWELYIIHSVFSQQNQIWKIVGRFWYPVLHPGRWVIWIREFSCLVQSLSVCLSVCLMLLSFSPVCIVMPASLLRACLVAQRILSFCFCICLVFGLAQLILSKALCFRYALHSVGCLRASWLGMAANGCMLLQLCLKHLDDLGLRSCQLLPFCAVRVQCHCGMTGEVFWSPLGRKRQFLNKIRAEVGSSMGQNHDALYEGQFLPSSHLRSNSSVGNSVVFEAFLHRLVNNKHKSNERELKHEADYAFPKQWSLARSGLHCRRLPWDDSWPLVLLPTPR